MEPLSFDQQVLQRLPLAEAVLLMLRQVTLPLHCLDLFQRFKKQCYTKILAFDLFVRLIADALLRYQGSGRQSFENARLQSELEVSNQAVYDKLAHIPLPLSEAFLAENTLRLLPLLPASLASPLPECVRSFRVLAADGKVVKRVAKTLKALWGLRGGVLGGKGLVAFDLQNGLACALACAADGLCNDAALVPNLVGQVRPLCPPQQTILWVADRQFCDLTQPHCFRGSSDHFLIRYSAKTHFTADPQATWAQDERTPREGVDARGRRWTQEWGWLGAPGGAKSLSVRRITLERPGEETVVLVTDLLDPLEFPAADLLTLYLMRWGIEQVFQKITEVFSLKKLIASRPKGTLFQLAFCLLVYNLIQVVRSHVASGQNLKAEEVSTEMLFTDVREELTAVVKLVGAKGLVALVPEVGSPEQLRERLAELLGKLWKPIWRKTTNRKRRAHQPKGKGRCHSSVQRVLEGRSRHKTPQVVGAQGP